MRTYEVQIRATITKTYIVEAVDRAHAAEEASSVFCVVIEFGVPEDYKEEVLHVKEVEE